MPESATSPAPGPALMQHAQKLLEAAIRAQSTLCAAAKIVRGGGHPQAADIIATRAVELLAAIRLASGEVSR